MQFDWKVFATTLLAGLGLAFAFWYVMRDVEGTLSTDRLERERQVITRHQREVSRLREKVEALERRVDALQVDIDTLHDALMKELRKPPRR